MDAEARGVQAQRNSDWRTKIQRGVLNLGMPPGRWIPWENVEHRAEE